MRGRCDHDPRSPRLALVVAPIPNQPWFTRDAIDRGESFYRSPSMFPELTGRSIAGREVRLRGRRSSRREAWALMAAAIARHTDRRTFRIGDQRDDGLCNGVSLARYEAETGLSRWRVSRTLREFEEAAYIVTDTQPVEALVDDEGRPLLDDDGHQRHRAFPAQRRVTPLFFTRLGFTARKVRKARARGYAEWVRRRAPAKSAAPMLGARRVLRRLAKANRARGRRLEAGRAPAAPPAGSTWGTFDPGRATERADRAAQQAIDRLYGPAAPDTGPPPKPSGTR